MSHGQSDKHKNNEDLVTKVHRSFSYVFQKRRPQLMQDRAGGMEEELKEGDLGMGTTARLDICTGTAICSGLRSEGSANPQLDKQGTHNLLLLNKMKILIIYKNIKVFLS